jgi:hypothetical protein
LNWSAVPDGSKSAPWIQSLGVKFTRVPWFWLLELSFVTTPVASSSLQCPIRSVSAKLLPHNKQFEHWLEEDELEVVDVDEEIADTDVSLLDTAEDSVEEDDSEELDVRQSTSAVQILVPGPGYKTHWSPKHFECVKRHSASRVQRFCPAPGTTIHCWESLHSLCVGPQSAGERHWFGLSPGTSPHWLSPVHSKCIGVDVDDEERSDRDEDDSLVVGNDEKNELDELDEEREDGGVRLEDDDELAAQNVGSGVQVPIRSTPGTKGVNSQGPIPSHSARSQ